MCRIFRKKKTSELNTANVYTVYSIIGSSNGSLFLLNLMHLSLSCPRTDETKDDLSLPLFHQLFHIIFNIKLSMKGIMLTFFQYLMFYYFKCCILQFFNMYRIIYLTNFLTLQLKLGIAESLKRHNMYYYIIHTCGTLHPMLINTFVCECVCSVCVYNVQIKNVSCFQPERRLVRLLSWCVKPCYNTPFFPRDGRFSSQWRFNRFEETITDSYTHI